MEWCVIKKFETSLNLIQLWMHLCFYIPNEQNYSAHQINLKHLIALKKNPIITHYVLINEK